MHHIGNAISQRGLRFWAALCLAGVGVLGILDFATGYEVSFSLFYLAPIAAASWYHGRWLGLAISIASAMTWLGAEIASGHQYSSDWIHIWNTLIRFGFFIIVTLLICRLRQAYRLEQALARHDRLTGLANARHFYDQAELELERARRFAHPFSVAYVDLDNFKRVNDQFGHAMGDQVLATVGRVMREHLRKIDLAARLGGDEFALLLPETDQAGVREAMAMLHAKLLAGMRDSAWPVTFSIGVVTYQTPPASVEAMLQAADTLMYAVKATHKNGVRYDLYRS